MGPAYCQAQIIRWIKAPVYCDIGALEVFDRLTGIHERDSSAGGCQPQCFVILRLQVLLKALGCVQGWPVWTNVRVCGVFERETKVRD